MQARIRILDEVNCVILGLIKDHTMALYEDYARKAPNYFFSPDFKLGRWDGNIRYFHKNGRTFVYLLDEIIPKILAFGYKVDVIDERTGSTVSPSLITSEYFSHIIHPLDDKPIVLRYYQVAAVNSLIEHGYGIVIAGTGAGKTYMTAALADSYGKLGLKTVTIVPSQDLILQTKQTFRTCELDTGEYSGDNKDYKHTHVVSTWQALQNNPIIMQEFNVVIVDECHGIKGNKLQELLNEHGRHIAHRFGFTGTLPKEQTDSMSVHVAIGDVRYKIQAHELIDQGYLAKLQIEIIQLVEDFTEQYVKFCQENPTEKVTYTQFVEGYLPDYDAEKSYLQKNLDRLEWIAAYVEAKKDLKKGNVLCLVDGIAFGKKISKLVPGAIFVYGKDKKKARKEIYDLFSNNDNLVVFATVQIASLGIDIPRIFNMMAIDVGKSFIRVVQSIGRGIRKAHDKDHVNFTDICSNMKYGKKHLRERKKIYREEKYPFKEYNINYMKDLRNNYVDL